MTEVELESERKKREKQARDGFLICLAIFLADSQTQAKTFTTIDDVPDDILKLAKDVYKYNFLDRNEIKIQNQLDRLQRYSRIYGDNLKNILIPRDKENEISQVSIQKDIIESVGTKEDGSRQLFKILNPVDAKTCSHCREWLGKTITLDEVDQWILTGGLHPHCRCSVHPVNEINRVDLNALDYMMRKTERLRDLIKFRMTYHEAPILNNMIFL